MRDLVLFQELSLDTGRVWAALSFTNNISATSASLGGLVFKLRSACVCGCL